MINFISENSNSPFNNFIITDSTFLAQYINSLNIFLDKDIEMLLLQKRCQEAYDMLCSKVHQQVINRFQSNTETAYDLLLFNNVEIKCIKSPDLLLTMSDGISSDYFFYKSCIINDSTAFNSLIKDELRRLYYLAYPAEFKKLF
jgi:hypothetical protein